MEILELYRLQERYPGVPLDHGPLLEQPGIILDAIDVCAQEMQRVKNFMEREHRNQRQRNRKPSASRR